MWIFSGRTVNVPVRPRIVSATVPRQQVRGPDETGDEPRRRALIDVGRCADLLDLAVVEDRQAVAHRERLLLVVGHVDEGDADLLLDRLQLDLHLLAELEVEGAQRLVEQQHARPIDQGAGESDPLALATGELAGLAPLVALQAHHPQRFGRRG